MNEYKPNSHKYKEEQAEQMASTEERKKIEKVVSGTVKTKKKGGFSKIASAFTSEDATSVKSYIVRDVMIPAIKKAISDTIDMILYGGSRRSKTNSSKVSYRSYYDRSYDEPRSSHATEARTGYSYDDIILESRGEAEEVLSQMGELIDLYGIVSVADLYDLVGITSNYTDNKYGWTNIRNAEPVRVRDGYMLKLPRALPIN